MNEKGSKNLILKAIVGPILILAVVVTAIIIIFSAQLGKSAEERAYRLIAESAEDKKIVIKERIESSFRQLDIIAAGFDGESNISLDENALNNLITFTNKSDFENAAVVTLQGEMLYKNGSKAYCSDRTYFKEAIKGGKYIEFLSKGRLSGSTVFVFSEPIIKNDKIIGAVVATRNIKDISARIAEDGQTEKQYTFLCHDDGEIISVPKNEESIFKAEDYISDYFKAEKIDSDITSEKIQKYNYNGAEYFGIYMQSGIDGIYVFSAADKSYASSLAGVYSKWSVIVVSLVFLIVLAAAVSVIIRLKRRIADALAYKAEHQKALEQYHEVCNKRSLERKNIKSSYHLNLSKNICIAVKGDDKNFEKFKHSRADLVLEKMKSSIHDCDKEEFSNAMSCAALKKAFESGTTSVERDFLAYVKNERYVWVRVIADLVCDPVSGDLEALMYVGGINDVRRLEQIGKKIILEDFVAMGLTDVKSGMIFGIKKVSDTAILEDNDLKDGFNYDEVSSKTLKSLLSESDFKDIEDRIKLSHVLEKLEIQDRYSLQLSVASKNTGTMKYFKLSYSYLDFRKESIIVSCENITDILSGKIDVLTGLYNSEGFHEKISSWIKNNPGRKYRLQAYNIDSFSNINAAYGYEAGNMLLRDIGKFMKKIQSDDCFAAHLNADHFARFCADDAITVQQCCDRFSKDFEGYAIKYPINIRMGVYDLCEPECDSYMMSYKAHLALQTIKKDLSKRVAYYKKGLLKFTQEQQIMLSEVEKAVKEQQFELYFQPQINYENGSMVGVEALIRWKHPSKGLIMPGNFIPLLESSRQIGLIDEYVAEQCCQYINRWRNQGIFVPISINISRIGICDEKMYHTLLNILQKYDVSPNMIRIEITESAYVEDTKALIEAVKRFRKVGFVIEMDDFGSGYSSLNILKDLDVDILKLDMFLVSQIGENNEKSDNIMQSVVQMAKLLDIAIIAEGVETKQQADYLKTIGCVNMQGFYFAKPMPYDEFEKMIKNTEIGELQ